MERQAGLGRSLEDVLDSVPRIEPTEPTRTTHALFGIAREDAPVANGTSTAHADSKKTKKKKKKKKKSKGASKKSKKK